MGNLDRIKVVDYTCGRRSSDDVNTDIPFSDNFAKTRTLQQANVVLGAYVNRNYKDNRQWLTELENKADKDEIPEKTSDLTNDGSDGENPFITNQVDDLINYTNNTDLNNIITPIENMLDGTKPAGNMIVDSIRSKNMFDKNIALTNAWLSDSGQISSYTNDNLVSGYIPVKPNTTYTVSGYYANKYLKICGYNSNKGFTQVIIDINSSQTYQTITTGSNDYFIRVGFGESAPTADTLQVEKGSVATAYSPYQNLNNKEIYSTNEIRIGTWIDGKPLYRKVFTGSFAGGTSTYTTVNDILPTTCTVRNLYGTTYPSSGNEHRRPINFYFELNNTSSFIGTWAVYDGSNSRWNLAFYYTQAYNTLNYEAIVEYTKTTD